MSLMLDKKILNVKESEDDNYKIHVGEFIKSRHIDDVLNYKINNTNTTTTKQDTTKYKTKDSRIIINKYNVDTDVDEDDHLLNENSVINQSDYRTHFIRKFKENKSRLNTRNQYSSIYVKQPTVDKTWLSNHGANTSGSSNNSNTFRPLNNTDPGFTSDSIKNSDGKHAVSINSIEKWSSHINKSNTNTGVNNNNNKNSNINFKQQTANQLKKQQPMTYNLLTHVISNPVARENTIESVNLQYDKPIDIHRDLIPTPHAYLILNDEPSINNRVNSTTTTITPTFTTATLSSISSNNQTSTNNNNNFDQFILRDEMQTPDTYVTINTPSKNISIYSRLTLPISNPSLNSTISTNSSSNLGKTTGRSKNKDLLNDTTSYTKRRNTFSISPQKPPINTTTIPTSTITKKSISFRKKTILPQNDDTVLSNSNIIEIPSRSASPVFEESSSSVFNTSTARKPKNSLLLLPSNTIPTTTTTISTSSSVIITKKNFVSSSQQQIQPQQQQQFKSQSNANLSPRRTIIKKKPTQQQNDKFLKQKYDPNHLELKEFKHCIITDLKIGEGEFGETFQGYRYDLGAPTKIAAKRLKNVKPNGEIEPHNSSNTSGGLNNPHISVANSTHENILAEVCVLSQLGKHDFVIEYLGVHVYSETMYMIFEYAEKGDLKRLLDTCRKNTRSEITINLLWKMKFAYEISSGMEYIASLGIVHKDIAARNILLQKDYTCKIADFGCCKTDFMVKRPIRWMSPESLNKSLFTSASDVWSFGIVS
jgi:hypothetical protein